MKKNLNVALVSNTYDYASVIASAGKLCYSPVGVKEILEKTSYEEKVKFIKMLAKMKHESPLEHVSFTFAIEGISRACSHQVVRHRIASFSQQSQRYVPLAQFGYIIPPAIEAIPAAKERFILAMEQDQDNYDALKELLYNDYMDRWSSWNKVYTEKDMMRAQSAAEKKAIEDARYVFPNACETKMVLTMNVRSLYHLFEHRCCDRAQWEIRELADAMLKILQQQAPELFMSCGPRCVFGGGCPEGNMSCGLQSQMKIKYQEGLK